MVGLRYLEKLIRCPGEAIGFADLVTDDPPEHATEAAAQTANESLDMTQWTFQPTLDKEALRHYNERLQEIETELEDARQNNNPVEREKLTKEKLTILEAVGAATNLGNKARNINSDTDKLRARIFGALGYPAYRELGLPIGSGRAEGLCKTLVEGRCKQSGMRNWTPTGAEAILRLRAARHDGVFDETWRHYLFPAA